MEDPGISGYSGRKPRSRVLAQKRDVLRPVFLTLDAGARQRVPIWAPAQAGARPTRRARGRMSY